MFERNVYDYYHLYCDGRFSLGDYEGFEAGNKLYVVLPKDECASSEGEMEMYAEYLRSVGDRTVLELLPTIHKKNSSLIDGQDVYVFRLPSNEDRQGFRVETAFQTGEHLATIHYYGKQMVTKQKTFDYFGQWPKLWERRLEQLEGWYQHVLFEGPQSFIDEVFLFTYPYFMGLTENAIQYAVDANIDDPGKDLEKGTICHRRFSDSTWLTLSEYGDIAKRPTDFVYDHPCRDLAEWIRSKRDLIINQRPTDIQEFFEGYEQYESLSTYGWRMMYARLLFPVHYFEAIENYYRSQIPEKRNEYAQSFFDLLENEPQNERFLEQFSEQIRIPRTRGLTPTVDWL